MAKPRKVSPTEIITVSGPLHATAGERPAPEPQEPKSYESMREEFMENVSEGLAHLPLRQREVLTMRYFEAKSLDEIAELLDIRVATVRDLLKHGVNNLRRHFKRSYLIPE